MSCFFYSPELPEDLVLSYIAEVVEESQLSVHAVSYNTHNPAAIVSIFRFNN